MLATSNDEAMQELWNECAKREDWLAFGDEWDAVDKPFRLKWRPTPYNVFAVLSSSPSLPSSPPSSSQHRLQHFLSVLARF